MQTNAPQTAVRTFSLHFLEAYVTTMRPYLLFVSGITGVAGASLVAGIDSIRALPVLLASFLSYGFGQALTDCFQTDTDTLSAPYRPLTRGVVTQRQVLLTSLAGLGGCVAIFALGHPFTLLLGMIGVLGLATYSFFKRRWWGGPFYNAWIVTNLSLIAFVAAGRTTAVPPGDGFGWMLAAVFWGYANFVLSGYFKDIEADRATGYNTLPVVYGRRVASITSDCFAFLAAGSAILAVRDLSAPVVLFLASGIAMSVIAQVRLHGNTQDADAHTAIAPVVHSYILTLSGVAVSRQPDWVLPLLLLYAGFVLTMRLRPAHNQI
jgi:4-hydroxybenzoate polyprenyltransferase